MGLILPRNRLVYPGGIPGYNPNHIASGKEMRYSGVPSGAAMVNLLTGKGTTTSGTVTAGFNASGPVIVDNTSNSKLVASGGIVETPSAITMAGIYTRVAGSSGGGSIFCNSNGSPSTVLTSGSGQLVITGSGSISTGIVPTSGHPSFIAASFNGANYSTVILDLINGALLQASGTTVVTPTVSGSSYSIGLASTGSSFMTGSLAAVMYSIKYMPLSALLAWAQAPWEFWYPPNVRQTIFTSLKGNPSQAFTLALGQGSYTLTGEAATFTKGVGLSAAQGSYSLTGEAAALATTGHMSAAQGSYTLTGEAVTLGVGMPAAQGSYTLTGEAVTFLSGLSIPAAHGTYSLTGEAVSFSAELSISASQGVYSLTGEPVTFLRPRSLSAGQGTYTLTGEDAALVLEQGLAAAQGTYSLTGEAVSFGATTSLIAAQGTYSLTGEAITLGVGMPASHGVYSLFGEAAELQKLAALRYAFGQSSAVWEAMASDGISISNVSQSTAAAYGTTTSMAGYLIGNEVGFNVRFVSIGGAPTDPSVVTLTLEDPNGVQSFPTITHTGTGLYTSMALPSVAGQWIWRWDGTGTVNAAVEGRFTIYASQLN